MRSIVLRDITMLTTNKSETEKLVYFVIFHRYRIMFMIHFVYCMVNLYQSCQNTFYSQQYSKIITQLVKFADNA